MTQEPPAANEATGLSEAAARISAARLLAPCSAFLAAALTAGTDALGPEGCAAGALTACGFAVYRLSLPPSSAKRFDPSRYAAPLAGFALGFFALAGAANALPEGVPWSAQNGTPWRRIIPVLLCAAMFALITALARPLAGPEEDDTR